MKTAAPRSRARIVGVVLALLFAAIALVLALQPWWLAPLVSHRLAASSQRAVHVDSMWLSLSASLQPVVQLRGIRIDNAPWADSRRPLAALDAATAVFSWRSIEERRPVVALMVLRGGAVDLERNSDGRRNWRLADPEDRGPGHFKVLAIRGDEATVRFLHGPLELDLEAHASAVREGAAGVGEGERLPTRIDVRGTWRSVPFVVSAATAGALTLLETGRMFRLRGQVEAVGARLELDGRAGDIVRWPHVDARLALVAPSLAPLAALFAGHGRETKPLRLDGTLRGDGGRYALSELRARLGATDVAGDLRWSRANDRDRLRAELTSESADLDDLRALAGRGPAAARAPAAHASDPAAAASTPPREARPRPLDVELRYAARRLHGAELPSLQSARLEASLVDGRLDLPSFEVRIGHGHVGGKASIDVDARPMRGDAEVEVSAMRIERLLGEKAAKGELSGVLRGRAVVKASGDSVEALLASAAGTVSVYVSDGTISSLLDAKIGLQGGRILRSMLAGAEPIALRCAAAVLDFARGEGRIRTLVVDTERTRTTGTGVIDLARQTVDVVLTPEAKQPGLFVLDRSIRLRGPLREPKHELVARAEPAAASARSCRERS